MKHRDSQSDESLLLKVAAGVVLGGLVLLAALEIRDALRERRAIRQINQVTEQLTREADQAEAELRQVMYDQASERDARRQEEAAMATYQWNQRQLDEGERCISGQLFRKSGSTWTQQSKELAALKCR